MKRYLLLILLLPVLVVAGFAANAVLNRDSGKIITETGIELPPQIARLQERTRAAYIHAVDHPEDLEHIPCYCGCNVIGHVNNLTCYVKEVTESGEVVFDTHAFGCQICVDITHDVMSMHAQGIPISEIRTIIDTTYAGRGPSTDTPIPAAWQ